MSDVKAFRQAIADKLKAIGQHVAQKYPGKEAYLGDYPMRFSVDGVRRDFCLVMRPIDPASQSNFQRCDEGLTVEPEEGFRRHVAVDLGTVEVSVPGGGHVTYETTVVPVGQAPVNVPAIADRLLKILKDNPGKPMILRVPGRKPPDALSLHMRQLEAQAGHAINNDKIVEALDRLSTAVLQQPAPVVNVPAPIVNVPPAQVVVDRAAMETEIIERDKQGRAKKSVSRPVE